MSERDRVARARAVFGSGGVPVGIGDDAAVLDGGLVWTVDAQVEGTHFVRAWLSWHDVGYRSFMAAASDLAAMGAVPLGALSSLVLAGAVDDAAFDAILAGQAEASALVSAPVVGGNLARGGETSITTTFLGRAEEPVLRSGAHEGDGVFLAGAVGLAAAGLAALMRGREADAPAACLAAWRRPRALVGIDLRGCSAAVDVSDGLAHDAAHIAEASGVRLELDAAALDDDALGDAARALGVSALDLALGGGEDYAILVTAPDAPADARFRRVGRVLPGSGIALRRANGTTEAIEARGFDHFR